MNGRLSALLLAATAMAPLAAHAQAANRPDAAAASSTSVGEVVVTAQRRTERLENVPVAITALSANTLATANITDLRQLVNVTPALRMDQTGIFTQPTIRGVGSGVTGPGANANIGLYVDGFYQPSEAGADFDLSNVTQVEVLKGPQGTLFGRNATGGAILITTADPSFTAHGDASVSYRSYDDARAQIFVSGPITQDLAGNLSVYGRRSEGWKTDVLTGQHDAPNDTFDLRGKLLYQPTDRFKVVLTYQHTDISDPSGAAYSTYGNNSIANAQSSPGVQMYPGAVYTNNRFNTAMINPPKNYIQGDGVYLKGQYNFDWGTLTSLTSYHTEKDKEQSELDRTSLDLSTATWLQREQTITQEVNLSNSKGPLNWVVGAFYYHDHAGDPYFDINFKNIDGSQFVTTNAYAVYADVTYEILHNLYLTGGVRYSDETQDLDSVLPSVVDPATNVENNYSHTWSSVNERAVLRYELAPNTNVYASYSNGFKSGVYNTLPPSSTPVSPETINAYEVGFKTAQHNWRFDASAFYYDYSNLQFTAYQFITINGTPTSVADLENAAKATIYGADAQLTYDFGSHFDVRLGGAWTHARYDSFPAAINPSPALPAGKAGNTAYVPIPVMVNGKLVYAGNNQVPADASGKTMVRAPEFTASLGVDYKTPLPYGRLTLSGNVYFSSTIYFDPNDLTSQPDYATLDLRATWTMPDDKWSVSLFGSNVTDTKYVTQIAEDGFGYGAVYGTPSTFGVELNTKF
jgi:iron complex outermembrane receptor protein